MKKIDFDYSFAPPHTITLSRPSASHKVLARVWPDRMHFEWTHRSLREIDPLTWVQMPLDVRLSLFVTVDGAGGSFSGWYRHKSGAPYLFAHGGTEGVSYTISAIACRSGVVIRSEAVNRSGKEKCMTVQMARMDGWVISNQGWIDGINTNLILAMNGDRADRVLCYAAGADEYPLYRQTGEDVDRPPMANGNEETSNPCKKITAQYTLAAGEEKTGYFYLPYRMYFRELEEIRKTDFARETEEALQEWTTLLNRGTRIEIEDEMLMHCYRSCIADLFVMREAIGPYTGISCGTDEYRSANSGEPLEAEILLDTLGYTEEATADYAMYLNGQDENGCWAYSGGWEHEGWGIPFNKANAVMTHYALTQDRAFLEENYPKMYRSTMFQHQARQSTKNAAKKAERGLMPRGMGDCGMMNNGDYYGVFYPHNCLSVAADRKTLEAAKILNKSEDIAFLTRVYQEAKTDLLTSMRENLHPAGGRKIIPSVADAPITSMFGCLYSYFPGGLVDQSEPMLLDTIEYMESSKISEGGLPVGTGWQKDGLWVAMALSNFARTYLRMGMHDRARRYLYPALNHATPFVTWCEERGKEKNSDVVSGDRQHLWTPLAVGQYLTEALFFEDEESVHLFAGACPEWLEDGKKIAVHGYRTAYGNADFSLENKNGACLLQLAVERPISKPVTVHFPSENTWKQAVFTMEGLEMQKEVH